MRRERASERVPEYIQPAHQSSLTSLSVAGRDRSPKTARPRKNQQPFRGCVQTSEPAALGLLRPWSGLRTPQSLRLAAPLLAGLARVHSGIDSEEPTVARRLFSFSCSASSPKELSPYVLRNNYKRYALKI